MSDTANIDPPSIKAAFGKVVASRRIEAALEQETFAKVCGLGASHLRKIEAGTVSPTLITVAKIAGALGTTSADIVDAYERLLR
ncbi:MAG: helix-turn-helix transcriptional regulator [Gordonibacter sp.]|uniref:helix-turn-helix domain-containing protein n=1 Tax=Gordonibacter sp. TaxID=1968902 RepID=UPI002FC74C5B